MKHGSVTVEERRKPNGDIVYRAVYNLSDEEKELLSSLTEDELNALLREIDAIAGREFQRRMTSWGENELRRWFLGLPD